MEEEDKDDDGEEVIFLDRLLFRFLLLLTLEAATLASPPATLPAMVRIDSLFREDDDSEADSGGAGDKTDD